MSFSTLKGVLDFNYAMYAIMSHDILRDMSHLYAQCKQMMDISDEEIDAYRKAREQMDESMSEADEAADSFVHKIMQQQMYIDERKANLNLE